MNVKQGPYCKETVIANNTVGTKGYIFSEDELSARLQWQMVIFVERCVGGRKAQIDAEN